MDFWVIGQSLQLKLHFEEFKLERKRDWLEICNKRQTGGTYGCKEYTGTKKPEDFLSEHNQVRIEFTSDFINNFKGFQIKAEIIGKSKIYTSISIAFIKPENGQYFLHLFVLCSK